MNSISDVMIQQYQGKLEKLGDAEKNKIKDIKQIKELAGEFESIFTELVLKSMRSSVQKGGLIDGGNGEDIFKGMLDSEYSKAMADQRSSGIADSIEKHLLQAYDPNSYNTAMIQKNSGMSAYSNNNK